MTIFEELRNAAEQKRWPELFAILRRERTSDYRSGYSCGYYDGKKGRPMRDAEAAELFLDTTNTQTPPEKRTCNHGFSYCNTCTEQSPSHSGRPVESEPK